LKITRPEGNPPIPHIREVKRTSATPEELSSGHADRCCEDDTKIGARLRGLRRQKKMSIRELAAACGISVNTLSLIENERTSPSLHTLQLLARGLGVPLATVFEEEKAENALVFQEHGRRAQVRFENGTLEKLSEGLPPLGAEPILVTLDPEQTEARDISHSGREFIYCLEGNMTCVVAGQNYQLATGDSLLFTASLSHHWLNAHPAPAKLLVLFCPMEAHDLPAERHLGY